MGLSAVITADIVNSTLLPSKTEKWLKDKVQKTLSPHKVEFYRGDSFQVLLKDPRYALRAVVSIRVIARKISPVHDIRASIGIGKTSPGIRKLSAASGEAFIFSGQAFDTLLKSNRRLAISSSNEMANLGFQTISYFADFLFRSLTAKQAEVFFALLGDKTQHEAARQLRKTQSTINKLARAGGWNELSRIIDQFEATVAKL